MVLLKMIVNIILRPPLLAELWQRESMRIRTAGVLLVGLATGTGACDKKPAPAQPAPSVSASVAAIPSRTPPVRRSTEHDEAPAQTDRDAAAPKLGALSDVGPAAPASAARFGVVMVTRNDDIIVTPLPTKPGVALEPVTEDAGAFVSFARGPAIAGDHAYWISKGRLVRRKLQKPAPLETLVEGARDGTRASALEASEDRPAAAAYIARPNKPDGDAVAMLWLDGEEALRLSPEGAAASSVAVAATDDGLIASYIEGRSGMSPVHARRLRMKGKKPVLDDDVVAWIGGSAQSLTEIVGGSSSAGEAWAFVPLERDATRFGLAEIRLGSEPQMGAPVTWRAYPNGLDPAPLAAAEACGGTMVAYAQPADAKPHAPQELHVALLGSDGLGPSQVVARSSAFANISLAATADALLLVYVADHRTWSVGVGCPNHK
jgi:hypothetical protein